MRPEDEARALFILANTLNRRSNFRGALDAYRASLDIRDDAAVRRIYEPILERHGFRFLDLQIDNDAASPRACFQFSERLPRRLDAAPFVQLPPGFQGAVTAEGQQVCVEGLRHGERYVFTLRPGLPSTVGESLRRPVEQVVYVRDRTPAVRFTGRNYVLPRTGQQGVPLVSVNLSEVAIEVLRYADRSVTYAVGDDAFMSQITAPISRACARTRPRGCSRACSKRATRSTRRSRPRSRSRTRSVASSPASTSSSPIAPTAIRRTSRGRRSPRNG